MVIQKPGRDRPSRQFIVDHDDLGMCDLARTGGLAAPVEDQQIWRDIGREIGAGAFSRRRSVSTGRSGSIASRRCCWIG
jgi:hypothetical protein